MKTKQRSAARTFGRASSTVGALSLAAFFTLAQAATAFAVEPELIFVSDRGGGRDIWKVSLEPGAQPEQLTTGADAYYPSWSVRNEIVYQSGSAGHLVLRKANGTIVPLSSVPVPNRVSLQEEYPSWSPDGTLIAYGRRLRQGTATRFRDIWVRTPDEPATLDVPIYGSAQGVQIDTLLWTAWSPDGKRIAFTMPYANSDVFVADFNTSGAKPTFVGVKRLTSSGAADFAPCWSPDGKSIAFQSGRSGGIDIYRMSSTQSEDEGEVPIRLTSNPANDRNPAWSPDGSRIAFVSERDGNREIYVMSATLGEQDTNAFVRITASSGVDENPSWTGGPDLIVNSFVWSTSQGGMDFQYDIRHGVLTNATTAKLFWTTGPTTNDIIMGLPAILTNNIRAGAFGTSAVINVPASQLTNPPSGATHVLLALDYDNVVPESVEANNVATVELQELVDAFTFQQGGVLPTDPYHYFAAGESRIGAVADGASRLVLRFHLGALNLNDPSLNLHFVLVGGESRGRLRPITSDTWSSDVSASLATQSANSKALCIYESPVDFPASATATVELRNRATVIATKEIRLKRPPVVLVHGIWSGPFQAWESTGAKKYFEDRLGPSADGFPVFTANYESSNAEEFEYNAPIVFNEIQRTIKNCRPSYACSKADVVGHSMGALLSRIAIQRYGQQVDNYGKGNVRKLISVGSPHQGSFLADQLILARRDKKIRYGIFAYFMSKRGKYVDRGAADNLSAFINLSGSPVSGLPDIRQTALPCHAITSTPNCGDPCELDGDLKELYAGLKGLHLYHDPRGSTSDGVVELTSQAGGLAGGPVTPFLATAQHTQQTGSQEIHDRIFRLLEAPIVSSGWFDPSGFTSFHGINIPLPLAREGALDAVAGSSASDTVGTWLVVNGLGDSQIVHPGEVTFVSVLASDNRPLQGFALIGGADVIEMTNQPFNFEFVVPSTAVGDLTLMAIATDSQGEPSVQFISLRVQPSASLQAIVVEPSVIEMRSADRYQLRVLGRFSDGVTRDITSGTTGTSYCSRDETRVQVDTNGFLHAVQNTTKAVIVSITNGAVWTNVQVTVDLANLPPTAVIFSDPVGSAGRAPLSIQFDGSASGDPELSPLSYRWDFGDGTTSDQPIPPVHLFSLPGEYRVRLVVSDAKGLNGTKEILVRALAAVRLEIRHDNGQPYVTLFGDPGILHVLEGSQNLQNWTPLVTNTLVNGSFEFRDTNSATLGQRFYRAIKP